MPYDWALDGISNTQTINPDALGHNEDERKNNLVHVLDGYFDQGAHHLNVNVFGKEKLIDAMEHPEKEEYANFTIRVSGYAVKFIDLTRTADDVIARTCHEECNGRRQKRRSTVLTVIRITGKIMEELRSVVASHCYRLIL